MEVKPYNIKELCDLYNTSRKTLLKWLKPFHKKLGKRNGNYYSVRQVRIIFDKLGTPVVIDN